VDGLLRPAPADDSTWGTKEETPDTGKGLPSGLPRQRSTLPGISAHYWDVELIDLDLTIVCERLCKLLLKFGRKRFLELLGSHLLMYLLQITTALKRSPNPLTSSPFPSLLYAWCFSLMRSIVARGLDEENCSENVSYGSAKSCLYTACFHTD
jgi:hypothetical protein